MKTITVKKGTDVREYAVNDSGHGLFIRRSDGTFQQKMGNCEFFAGTARQLRRKIQSVFLAEYDGQNWNGRGWRMIDKKGWN